MVRASNFKFEYATNEFATHQPVLHELLKRTAGPVLELGCGAGSTPLIHQFAPGRKIVTVDNDPTWLIPLKNQYENQDHQFLLVADWKEALQDPRLQGPWDVVFVDQNPWEARHESLLKFKDTAQFLLLHDSDYFPLNHIFGTLKKNIISFIDEGERDYGDIFKYWKEFFPKKPWLAATGPPTLVGSNKNPCDFNVSFDL